MEIEYKILEEDYLTYQLYNASKSKLVKKKRLRNWFAIPVLYLIFAAFAYFRGNQINIALVFSLLAIVWISVYPFYSKWLYKRHYKKFVHNNNKELFGRSVHLSYTDKKLILSDDKNQSTIDLSEIKIINEISSHFFVKLKSNASIIIPKNQVKEAIKFVHEFAQFAKININEENNWKWK